MQRLERYYTRLDDQVEEIDYMKSGNKIVRYGNDPLSPILTNTEETLALIDYESQHLDEYTAWLTNTVSHGIAQVERVSKVVYQVDNKDVTYWIANKQTVQKGYNAVYHYVTLFALSERVVGSTLHGYILVERQEIFYPYPSTHRLFRYLGERVRA